MRLLLRLLSVVHLEGVVRQHVEQSISGVAQVGSLHREVFEQLKSDHGGRAQVDFCGSRARFVQESDGVFGGVFLVATDNLFGQLHGEQARIHSSQAPSANSVSNREECVARVS